MMTKIRAGCGTGESRESQREAGRTLQRWKQSVEDKLETLDDIYRFAVEQVTNSRGQFLELTVVLSSSWSWCCSSSTS
jgi:hypothetical protein